MSPSPEAPIGDQHIEFARALVALARAHGASNLEVKFSLTGGRRFFEGGSQFDQTRVTFQWTEGRHGAPSRFGLRAEATISIDETEDERGKG